ncbi:MAG TPA: serine/threonine-protein kinase [Polyangiaceae bacterium]|nr:serine/threonine-protein kinase [Polyangiaceae bacterium]
MQAVDSVRTRDRSGQMIAGRYRLDAQINRGGQGVIYRATDTKDNDQVAVKILSDSYADAPEWRERMLREAQAMTVLQGTWAVRVFDQQWSDDGLLCLIMELLVGSDFEDYLRAIEGRGQKLSIRQLASIMDPVAQTLEVAHNAGILHRDLKPGNIFVLNDGSVRLLDFGFAKFMRMRAMTQVGFVAGSPSYIAPEAWKGDPSLLDHRIDVYGLAAVIFRALSGKPPFLAGELLELLKLATTGKRPSLHALRPDLPKEVDEWVEQALAIEPSDRFLRVRGMWMALRQLGWK